MSLTPLVKLQFGAESAAAPGVPVTANHQFVMAKDFKPQMAGVDSDKGVAASFRDTAVIPEEEWTDFDMAIDWDYRDFGWVASSCFGQPVLTITGDDTNGYATGAYHHVFRPSSYKANILQTFTFQYGLTGLVFQCAQAQFNKLMLKTKRSAGTGNVSGDAAGFARRREATPTPNTFDAGQNAIQTFDFTDAYGKVAHFGNDNGIGNATLHDVTLSSATLAADIQTALDDIFGATNTLVAGSAGVFTVTYQGTLVGMPAAQINVVLLSGTLTTAVTTGATSATQTLTSTSGMHPGDTLHFATAGVDRTVLSITSGTVVVLTASVTSTTSEVVTKTAGYSVTQTQTQLGGVKINGFVPVLPNEISIWYSSLKSDLFVAGGTALMLNEFSTDLSWDKIADKVFTQNRANTSYSKVAELGSAKGRTETIDVTIAVDSQGMQNWDDWRAGAQKFWGFQALSQNFAAGTTRFEIRIFGSVSCKKPKGFTDNDGIWSIQHQMKWTDNPQDGGKAFEIHLTTDVASYAVA